MHAHRVIKLLDVKLSLWSKFKLGLKVKKGLFFIFEKHTQKLFCNAFYFEMPSFFDIRKENEFILFFFILNLIVYYLFEPHKFSVNTNE